MNLPEMELPAPLIWSGASPDATVWTPPPTLLDVQELRVGFELERDERGQPQHVEAVGRGLQGVSFTVPVNTTVALVGESGSGKSVTAMSIVGLLPDNARCQGRILWQPPGGAARDLLQTAPATLRALRGRDIACVFQDPMSSLNPVFTIGEQLIEPLRLHLKMGRRAALARAAELLAEVGIPEPARRLNSYPHELSGGQQQRVMIAMALACEPKLLIADEPTTALDVTIQRQIIELLARLKAKLGLSMLFISHDLALVGEIADSVVVMRHGTVRESGWAGAVFTRPQDAYTQALLACRPSLHERPARLPVIEAHMAGASPSPQPLSHEGRGASLLPLPSWERVGERGTPPKDANAPVVLEARALAKRFFIKTGLWDQREFKAVQGVNFTLRRGHTLGVVGESGSGKTTMGLTLLRLHEPSGGEVFFHDRNLLTLSPSERQAMRQRIQIVFQNPYASLNPRFTVAQTLLEPMRIHRIGADEAERLARARALLHKVGLPEEALGQYPHEFSGGQRQRIAIARCLTLNPEVLVLDEAVSALDVSVQAQVLNLLRDLQDELGLAYVFISHDLAVVRFMADEVLVMKEGEVVEQASAEDILLNPQQDYTRRLMGAVAKGWRHNATPKVTPPILTNERFP
jgi:peptide/nickel transport system ATP-binding protein